MLTLAGLCGQESEGSVGPELHDLTRQMLIRKIHERVCWNHRYLIMLDGETGGKHA